MEFLDEFWKLEDSRIFVHFVFSVVVGMLCKYIASPEIRRWISSCVGFINIFLWSPLHHTWHFVLSVVLCCYLIIRVGKKNCHLVALLYMFTYITIVRMIVYNECRKINKYNNLLQMLSTCKLVGVAFDIHRSHLGESGGSGSAEDGALKTNPSFQDLLHYGFSYFGMYIGPYIRYQTFDDSIRLPFSRVVDSKYAVKRLAGSSFFLAVFSFIDAFWPVEYVATPEFAEREFITKFVFSIMQFFRFQFCMYCALFMGESVVSAGGVGAYPQQAQSRSTVGPCKDYATIKNITLEEAKTMSYDFNTISTIDIVKILTCPWQYVVNRNWNKTIQYFMGVYIYGLLPKKPNLMPYRISVTILICALWHGIDPGYFIGMISMPAYLPTESLYRKIYEQVSGWRATIIELLVHFSRIIMLTNGTIAFCLLDFEKIMSFHRAVYFYPYIYLLVVHLLGICILFLLKKHKKHDN